MRPLLFVMIVLGGFFLAWRTFGPHLPAAERGRRLAESQGCFGCHGPEGTHGTVNLGRLDKTAPAFGSDVMMYAKTRDELREWIRDGSTAHRRASQTWQNQRALGTLRMPAFGRRLKAQQIEDLIAFVEASAGPEIPEPLAQRGLERAEALGCTGCHGAGGRFARRNPGSLKSYVPAWDGADFSELVRDSTEFREWVERGVSRKFEHNPAARFFLDRAVLHMPAFRGHLAQDDVPALWAYVTWLRKS